MRTVPMTALVVAALTACRHTYQADSTLLGDGGYLIRSAPEDEQRSEMIAAQAAYRRAAEICPAGYTIIDYKYSSAQSTETVAIFGRRTVNFPEVTIVITCKA